MRDRIYLDDGAIAPWQLGLNDRHCSPADTESWHLLTLDDHGSVSGCVRYREHRNATVFQELGLRECALASCEQWGTKLEAAVESDLATARQLAISFVEVGGWALAKERRCTGEVLRTALATYSLAEMHRFRDRHSASSFRFHLETHWRPVSRLWRGDAASLL